MNAELPAVGVHPTSTDQSMPVLELAGEVEQRGLRSIYFPEHTHVPVGSRETSSGWVMPARYQRVLDPYIASAFVAATTSLEVGTGVSLLAEHDAIALAKAISTLDCLSDGRVVLGVGFGYNRQEAEDHGFPAQHRARVVEETVGLMRALWSSDEASFQGQFRRVSRSWAWPKPRRPGGPLVLLGSRATARNLQRIVEWADGWLPMGSGADVTELAVPLRDLRALWQRAGRAGQPEICYFFDPGDTESMARQIDGARQLGIQRMQVFLEDRGRDAVLPILDRLAKACAAATG